MFIIIFVLSSQNGQESSNLSQGFISKILNIIFNNISFENKLIIISKIEFIIRKLAHFTLYFFVGTNAIMLFKTYNIKNNEQIALALLIGVIYAVFDEIHQVFVPGRAGKVTDVAIDTLGVISGIYFVIFFIRIKKQFILKNMQ